MKNKIAGIVGAIIAVFALMGGLWAMEDRYAKDNELNLLSERLEIKIVEDKIYNLQKRVWSLEDRYGGKGVPDAPLTIRMEYRELLKEITNEKNKMKSGD